MLPTSHISKAFGTSHISNFFGQHLTSILPFFAQISHLKTLVTSPDVTHAENTSTHISIFSFKNYGFLYHITPESHLHKLTYFWNSGKLRNWFNNKLFLPNKNNQLLCFLHTYAKQLSQPEPNSLSGIHNECLFERCCWMLDRVLNVLHACIEACVPEISKLYLCKQICRVL